MSPRLATLLALVGVLLAGIPLPALTRSREAAPEPPAAETAAPQRQACYATLRFTGQPVELIIFHEGEELARLPGNAESPCGLELPLPPLAGGDMLELEVRARWADPAPQQALTLTLEPDRLPARSDTQWAEGESLHNLFTFTW